MGVVQVDFRGDAAEPAHLPVVPVVAAAAVLVIAGLLGAALIARRCRGDNVSAWILLPLACVLGGVVMIVLALRLP